MGHQTNIYVFQREDGSLGADFSLEKAQRLGKIKKKVSLKNPQDVINNPGELLPDRVRALAERALQERGSALIINLPYIEPQKKGFWTYIKSLFLGD